MIEIDSDYVMSNPNVNFRVAAGPGAGKTHWLVQHMLGIIRKPEQLGNFGKIACITYTNIGVETIVKRLGSASRNAEVSTVHSFFYQNVVKPYLCFIADDVGIDVTKLDGHDERILSEYNFLQEWKEATGQKHLFDNEAVVNAISDLMWTRKTDGSISLQYKPNRFHRNGKYPLLKKESYRVYKEMAWKRGVVHHDDVLYFTHEIFKKHPFLLIALQAKYPYFLIDEFQDSSPLQISIFRSLAESGTYIGIIGDAAQSIYGFNGANPNDFQKFKAPKIVDYVIRKNRRSSNEILGLLNAIRLDIQQQPSRNVLRGPPKILIGTMKQSLEHAQRECLDEPVVTLSRNNATANLMKKDGVGPRHPNSLFSSIVSSDSDYPRRETIVSCVKAVEYALNSSFDNGLKEIAKALHYSCPKDFAEKRKVEILISLVASRTEYESKTLFDFAVYLRTTFSLKLKNFAPGKPKQFYEKYTYADLAACVSVADDHSENRTIHKAKGDEFDNVLLLLGEEKMLDVLFSANLLSSKSDEQRILYVAVSRARNRLFINVPELCKEKRGELDKHFQIVDVV